MKFPKKCFWCHKIIWPWNDENVIEDITIECETCPPETKLTKVIPNEERSFHTRPGCLHQYLESITKSAEELR